MPTVESHGYDVHDEVTCPSDGPTLVLIAGLGEQIGSVEYPEEQCEASARRGFRVVRVDNRTMGLSQPRDGSAPQPFTRQEIADDIAAVIRDLGDEPVHLVGASMGGALVRWTTVLHPELVATLTVVMAGAGADPSDAAAPQIPTDAVTALRDMPVRRARQAAIDAVVPRMGHVMRREQWEEMADRVAALAGI